MFREHVAYGSSCHGEECTSCETVEEAGDEHCRDIFGDGAGDDPDYEEDV